MKLYLDVALVDEYHRVHARIREEVTEDCAYMGPRVVDEIRGGVYWDTRAPSPMNAVATIMQVREVRREKLKGYMRNIGGMIADFLHDREGWAGADRQRARERSLKP